MNTCIGAGNFLFYFLYRIFYFLSCIIAFSAYFTKKNYDEPDLEYPARFIKKAFIFFVLLKMV